TVRGSQSPKMGLMRRQPRHQSSRVRGALRLHSSVFLYLRKASPSDRAGSTVSSSEFSNERFSADAIAGEGAALVRVCSHRLFHSSARAHASAPSGPHGTEPKPSAFIFGVGSHKPLPLRFTR